MSIWSDMQDRGSGASIKKEDIARQTEEKTTSTSPSVQVQNTDTRVRDRVAIFICLTLSILSGLGFLLLDVPPTAVFIAIVPLMFIILVNIYIDIYGDDGWDNYM